MYTHRDIYIYMLIVLQDFSAYTLKVWSGMSLRDIDQAKTSRRFWPHDPSANLREEHEKTGVSFLWQHPCWIHSKLVCWNRQATVQCFLGLEQNKVRWLSRIKSFKPNTTFWSVVENGRNDFGQGANHDCASLGWNSMRCAWSSAKEAVTMIAAPLRPSAKEHHCPQRPSKSAANIQCKSWNLKAFKWCLGHWPLCTVWFAVCTNTSVSLTWIDLTCPQAWPAATCRWRQEGNDMRSVTGNEWLGDARVARVGYALWHAVVNRCKPTCRRMPPPHPDECRDPRTFSPRAYLSNEPVPSGSMDFHGLDWPDFLKVSINAPRQKILCFDCGISIKFNKVQLQLRC